MIDESIEEVQCILNGMGVEVDVNESDFSVKEIGLRFCIPGRLQDLSATRLLN